MKNLKQQNIYCCSKRRTISFDGSSTQPTRHLLCRDTRNDISSLSFRLQTWTVVEQMFNRVNRSNMR